MKLVFATGNLGKLREAAEILGPDFELLTPADLGITEEIPETGNTFRANSLQKAEYIRLRTGLDCFADDSGLEVDALGGAPGIHSARYAAPGHDFDANITKLLAELAKVPDAPRTARFRTVVTLLLDDGPHFFEGTMEGRIAERRAGCRGFGYDPVFIADAYPDRTLAEVDEDAKNAISHRGNALAAMVEALNH